MDLNAVKRGFLKSAAKQGLSPAEAELLFKKANIGDALMKGLKWSGNARNWPKMVTYPLAAGLPIAGAESIIRSHDGQLGDPKTIGSIASWPMRAIGNMTGAGAGIQNVTKNVVEGATQAPTIQKHVNDLVGASSKIYDASQSPAVQNAAGTAYKAVDLADQLANPERQLTALEGIRRGIGNVSKGFFDGFGKSVVTNPWTMPGLIAGTTVPLVAYDLATRKKREERAQLDYELLNHLRQKNNQRVKTAGMWDTLGKLIYKPIPKIPASQLTSLARSSGGGINPETLENLLAQNTHKTQSLFNNSLSRNPGKTLLAGAAGTALGEGAYQTMHSKSPNALDFIGGAAKGAVDFPSKMLKGLELRGLAGRYDDAISNKFTESAGKIKQNISGAAQNVINPHPPAANTQPTVTKEEPFNAKPWAGVGLGLITPYAAYNLYDRYHNKDRRKLDEQNTQLKQDVLPEQQPLIG